MLPTGAVLLAFFFVPLGLAVHQSFFSWDLLTPPRFVGTRNYEALARGDLGATFARTLAFSAIVVAGATSLGLALALLLRRPGRVFGFVRAAVFSAYVVSHVSVALLWTWLLDADMGVVSALARALGARPRAWLGDPDTALVCLALVSVWKIAGYAMVVFLAALEAVPPSLLEAAALDGAGPARRFLFVTLPLLRPSLAFVSTTALILSFQAFDVVRVMTQGGPIRSTTVFVYAIYEEVFVNLRVGRASALAVLFFGLLLVLTTLQLALFRRGLEPTQGGERGAGRGAS